jgi:hypothetical protein
MKVLAFLQNQWVNEPEKVVAMIARTPKVRPRLIKYALFQSLTGHRLKQVFGDECLEWEWDNASPQIGSHSASCFPADPEHIKAVLEEHKPDVVLTFGKVASDALKKTCDNFKLIVGPHPAARKDDILAKLEEMADALKEYRDENVLEHDDNGRPRRKDWH